MAYRHLVLGDVSDILLNSPNIQSLPGVIQDKNGVVHEKAHHAGQRRIPFVAMEVFPHIVWVELSNRRADESNIRVGRLQGPTKKVMRLETFATTD
jgi:hypothetical protein